METLTAELVAPWVMEIEFDDTLSEKSASGGGGGGELEDEPPQPAYMDASETRIAAGTP